MAYKVQNGVNENEVSVIPKNFKKLGFLRNFFNYLASLVFSGNISCFLFSIISIIKMKCLI